MSDNAWVVTVAVTAVVFLTIGLTLAAGWRVAGHARDRAEVARTRSALARVMDAHGVRVMPWHGDLVESALAWACAIDALRGLPDDDLMAVADAVKGDDPGFPHHRHP